MTMNGILDSISTPNPTNKGSQTNAKAKQTDSDFGSILNLQANSQDTKDVVTSKADVGKKDGKELNELNTSKEPVNTEIKTTTQTEASEEKPDLETESIEEDAMKFLKETFELSDEDIEDILSILGLTVQDLLISFNDNLNAFKLLDSGNIKDFVMELYGVEDESVFLTNELLQQMLETVTEGLKNVLKESLDVPEKDFDSIVNNITLEEIAVNDSEEVSEEVPVTEISFDIQKQTTEQNSNTFNDDSEFSETEEVELVREDDRTVSEQAVTMTERFANRLENARGTEETLQINAAEQMRNIVDQIVNHVRVRVLPDTTSMELMLNPASLGRVLVSVSNANGVSNATMTVQSEAAKEAIENQIAALLQVFEEKGIKVNAIEVNVSEFGFHNEKDGMSEENQEQGNKKNKNKKFKMISDDTETVDSMSDLLGESQINYQA